jgi:tetratricopeptide (TPR) repeat protein
MSKPPSASKPATTIDIRCRDAGHLQRELERRSRAEGVFVPSSAPAPEGQQLDFRFYVPDGPEVRVSARVTQSIPPADGEADSAGMLVEFGDGAARAARRLRGRSEAAGSGCASARPQRQAILPGARDSQPVHTAAETRKKLEELDAELRALVGKDDAEVLGLPPDATAREVHDAARRRLAPFDTATLSAYGSQTVLKKAARIVDRISAAQQQLLADAQVRSDAPERLRLRGVERDHPAISDAAALLEREEYAKAQMRLSSALSKAPEDRDARLWLLVAQGRQAESWDDYDTAFERYRDALALVPDHSIAGPALARVAALRAAGGRGPSPGRKD